METERLHGDVIAGISAYHELDHELVTADTDVPECWLADDLASSSAGDDHELTGDQVDRLRQVARRPDADVQRDVLRALLLEGLVPLTVDARVAGGSSRWLKRRSAGNKNVRTPGTRSAACREFLASNDGLVRLPRPGIAEAAKAEVVAALARTGFADVAEARRWMSRALAR